MKLQYIPIEQVDDRERYRSLASLVLVFTQK